jgi:gamma-glutamyltranspeptidase / glutathione hydrolase
MSPAARPFGLMVVLMLAAHDPSVAAPPAFAAVRGDRASGWSEQTRSEVLARNGVVATSQPLAAEAGLAVLKRGGNAFDAAVATAAVLNVVEPASAGIGGDVFVLAWSAREQRLIGLNGSGRAPSGASTERIRALSTDGKVPHTGIHSATVPGAVDGWAQLLERYGTLGFRELLEPAARLAEEGFAVTERIHSDWAQGVDVLKADPDSARTYLPGGRVPQTYEVFRNPDLARAFRVLEAGGRDAFYRGEIAAALLAKSAALGGTFTAADLEATQATWVEPISTTYHGYGIHELPPNTQGFAVLEMMNILEVCAPKLRVKLDEAGPRSPDYWQLLVEAKKLAYEDLYAFNADPDAVEVPVARLTSKAYAATLCRRIDLKHASAPPRRGDPVGGTVYIAVADRFGNMVSFIYSIYDTFGAGVTVPGYGFVLNDRGALFSLEASSPNRIAPGKRPFHTLIPGFVTRNGRPLLAYGLMGGGQQAQGHAQVLVDMLDLGANPQAASDAARFSHFQATNLLELETGLERLVGAKLRARGHKVVAGNGEDMGGFQGIWWQPASGTAAPADGSGPVDGTFRAASDHRKDGAAAGW